MPTTSYWSDTAAMPAFPALASDLAVDVAVIGGGITGVTTAYLMKRAGLAVALLERDRCAAADTGHTTSHLTYVTDTRLPDLVSSFGKDHAAAAWDAGAAAIEQIESIARSENIACELSRVPGFLSESILEDSNERDRLRDEAALASELGFPAAYVNAVPVFERPGVRFPNQARMHPLRYLAGMLKQIPGDGCHVFEHTQASVTDGCIEANGHRITYNFLVIATDAPIAASAGIAAAALLQTKLAPYTTYVVGGRAPNRVPDTLVWDTSDPYFYLRVEEDGDYVMFGGADHKTGQSDDPERAFEQLAGVLRRHVPGVVIDHRWSGQVIETIDGLPYIGERANGEFVATGFSGNGITFGTVAAMMARDKATGRRNPWEQLFDVHRKKLGGLWDYVRENKDYPYYMIKDRLARTDAGSIDQLERGDGALLRVDGDVVAAYRDERGEVTMLSPVCTHMGCIVHWNGAEKTWDCPCHGSRFRATGAVFAGPAESPLETVRTTPARRAAGTRR